MRTLLFLALLTTLHAEEAASEGDITKLITSLGDDSFEVRKNASDALRKIGFPAFEKLKAARNSNDIEIARAAKKLVGNYEVIQATLDKLPEDWHSTLYYSGLTSTQLSLVEHGPAVVPYIAHRLKTEKDPLYRFNCVTILDKLAPESLPVLRTLLKDSHPWTRTESAWALGTANDTESAAALMELYKTDTDKTVKKEALIAVGKVTGVHLFAHTPRGIVALTSDLFVTDATRAELEKIVEALAAKRELPPAPKAMAINLDGLDEENRLLLNRPMSADPELQGEWTTKVLLAPNGKDRWIITRFDKPLDFAEQPEADK